MAILAQDNFVQANQTGWGTSPSDLNNYAWTQVRGSMNWSIASNEGACNSASGGTFNIFRLSSLSPTDQEILVRVKPADTSDIGAIGRYNSTTQFYYAVLTGGNSLVIGMDNSGFSTLASATFSYSAGLTYWLRFRLAGTSLSLKGWADGSSEPTTWSVTKTDSTFSSGGFGLGSDSSSATNTLFDNFIATDATIGVPAESVTVSETITLAGSASFSESVQLAESNTQTGAISLSDAIALFEMITQSGTVTFTDTVTVSETVTQAGSIALTEVVLLSESLTQIAIISLTDTVQLSESVSFAALTILTLSAESVQLTEVIALAGLLSLSEAVQLGEGIVGAGTFTLPAESVTLSETVTFIAGTTQAPTPIHFVWTTRTMSFVWRTRE